MIYTIVCKSSVKFTQKMAEYVLECDTCELYCMSNMGRANPTNRYSVKIDKFGNMDIDIQHYNIGLGYNPVSINNAGRIHDNIQIPDYLLNVIKTLITGSSLSPIDIYGNAIIPAIYQIKEGIKSIVGQKNPDATTWKLLVAKNEKLEADIIAANKKCDDLINANNILKRQVEWVKTRYSEYEGDLLKREARLRESQMEYTETSRKVLVADRKIADANRALKEENARLSAEWTEMDRKFKNTLLYNADLRGEVRMLRDKEQMGWTLSSPPLPPHK